MNCVFSTTNIVKMEENRNCAICHCNNVKVEDLVDHYCNHYINDWKLFDTIPQLTSDFVNFECQFENCYHVYKLKDPVNSEWMTKADKWDKDWRKKSIMKHLLVEHGLLRFYLKLEDLNKRLIGNQLRVYFQTTEKNENTTKMEDEISYLDKNDTRFSKWKQEIGNDFEIDNHFKMLKNSFDGLILKPDPKKCHFCTKKFEDTENALYQQHLRKEHNNGQEMINNKATSNTDNKATSNTDNKATSNTEENFECTECKNKLEIIKERDNRIDDLIFEVDQKEREKKSETKLEMLMKQEEPDPVSNKTPEPTSETEATTDKEKPTAETRTPPSDKSLPEPIEAPITPASTPSNIPRINEQSEQTPSGDEPDPVSNKTPEPTSETEATTDKEKPTLSGDDKTPVPNAETRTLDKSLPEPIETPITENENAPMDDWMIGLDQGRLEFLPEIAKLEEWKCTVCGKTMKNKVSAINQHIGIHIEKEKLECNFSGCEYKTNRPNILKQHKKNNHKEVSCQYCKKKFPNSKDLKEHTKVEHPIVTTCPVCHKKFPSKSNMTKHNNSVHKKLKKSCKKCKKQYSNNQNLKEHIKRHCSNDQH